MLPEQRTCWPIEFAVMSLRTFLPTTLACCLLLVACSSEGDPETAPTPRATITADPDETTPQTSETPFPADGRGEPAFTTSVIADLHGELGPDVAIAPNDGTDGTAGSGCSPGTPDDLPDGVWFVEVTGFDENALIVDLQCFTTVTSAEAAGIEEPIIDFAISNEVDRTRRIFLGENYSIILQTIAPIIGVDQMEGLERRWFPDVDLAMAFAARAGDATPYAWILVESGSITELYQPPLISA